MTQVNLRLSSTNTHRGDGSLLWKGDDRWLAEKFELSGSGSSDRSGPHETNLEFQGLQIGPFSHLVRRPAFTQEKGKRQRQAESEEPPCPP